MLLYNNKHMNCFRYGYKINWKDTHQKVNHNYLWVVGLVVTLYSSLYFFTKFFFGQIFTINTCLSQGPARKTAHTK